MAPHFPSIQLPGVPSRPSISGANLARQGLGIPLGPPPAPGTTRYIVSFGIGIAWRLPAA